MFKMALVPKRVRQVSPWEAELTTEMHHEGAITNVDVSERDDVDQLRGSAVGLPSVLFLCITGSAPLAVTLFNTPYVGPLGSGWGGPGAFLFATIVLTIFSVAYVQMCLRCARPAACTRSSATASDGRSG